MKIFDKNNLFERLIGDKYLAKDLIDVFLIDIPDKLARLDQAVSNENMTHNYHGSSLY